MSHFRTVAIDFDGVIHSYTSGWTGYEPLDDPEPGAKEFVYDLLAQGYIVVVMSARAHCPEGVLATEAWLERHGFPELRVTNEKVMAIAYIDDRAVPYVTGSGAWSSVFPRIAQLADRAAVLDVAPTTENMETSNG